MKKLIAIVLIFVLCLSLCACGASKSQDDNIQDANSQDMYKEALMNEVWKDVFTGYTCEFYENGTGKNTVGRSFTWEIKDSQLFIVYENTYTYSFITENDILRFASIDGSELYVAESNYEEVCATVERPTGKITDNEGNVVELLPKELLTIHKSNKAKFDHLYLGANITFVGTVKKVNTEFTSNGGTFVYDSIIFEEGWEVYLLHDSHKEILISLDVGDKLEVSSQIAGCFMYVEIKGVNKDGSWSKTSLQTTTIKPVE